MSLAAPLVSSLINQHSIIPQPPTFGTASLPPCRQSQSPVDFSGVGSAHNVDDSLEQKRSSVQPTVAAAFWSLEISNAERGFDAHAYTSGRWLRGDELGRSTRYITFDFETLCRRVIELCLGAASISNCQKKGGSDGVFIFTTDNGQSLVADSPLHSPDHQDR